MTVFVVGYDEIDGTLVKVQTGHGEFPPGKPPCPFAWCEMPFENATLNVYYDKELTDEAVAIAVGTTLADMVEVRPTDD